MYKSNTATLTLTSHYHEDASPVLVCVRLCSSRLVQPSSTATIATTSSASEHTPPQGCVHTSIRIRHALHGATLLRQFSASCFYMSKFPRSAPLSVITSVSLSTTIRTHGDKFELISHQYAGDHRERCRVREPGHVEATRCNVGRLEFCSSVMCVSHRTHSR